ncbi:MAG: hypothetical protein IKO20_09480 [Bacteroidaceae bacterium]|nr:hypothetical protein [Bacteroidaceae bacterium]
MKQTATTRSKFIARWSERGYEKGETQQFWIELLTDVLGIADASSWLTFEQHVPNIGFIDARIPRTKVLIEQKSALLDLFRVLNTPLALRDAYLEPELAAFPYVNGGLFREETPIPPFTPRLRQLILKKRCARLQLG